MAFKCGKCSGSHEAAATARACHAGAEVGPCHWLVEFTPYWEDPDTGYAEAGEVEIRDCGAEAVYTDRGFECVDGHEYTNMQTRHDEGWEYAEDEFEAANLARAGVDPVLVGTY